MLYKVFIVLLLSLSPLMVHAQKRALPANMVLAGKALYTQRCATCHQADGTGAQNMIPPLIKTEYVLGEKGRLIKIVLNGLNAEMTVNGDMYAGEMPPHKDLKDEEIAAVLTYVRISFGNKASVVTVKDVKKARAANQLPASK